MLKTVTTINGRFRDRKDARISVFDNALLYAEGLFETLLTKEDVIISDELNHASIIDGVRLCKAERRRFKNSDMVDLENILKETGDFRVRLIATDGAD